MGTFLKKNPISVIRSAYGGLPKSIYVLFIARVINRMGGFVGAFLSLYLANKLNMTKSEIANFVIISGFVTMLAPFVGGYIADSRGRKKLYIIAQGAAGLLYIPCGLLTNSTPEIVPYLLIGASLLSSLVGPVNSAMVADIAKNPDDRKKAYSLLYLGINVGVAIGPLIGGFMLAEHVDWFFYIDAISTLISLVLVGLFVKETMLTKEEMKAIKGGEKMESGFFLLVLFKKPVILAYTFFAVFGSMVYAQSGYGLSLHLNDLFGTISGPKNFGYLMSFNAVIVLVFTIVITELLKKQKPIFNLALSSLLYVVGFGMMGYVGETLWPFFVSVFIWTIGEIIGVTNQSVFVMANTPVNYRGRFNAFIGFLTGAGYVISPKIMSFAIENQGYLFAWRGVGVFAAISCIGYILTGLFEQRLQNQEVSWVNETNG